MWNWWWLKWQAPEPTFATYPSEISVSAGFHLISEMIRLTYVGYAVDAELVEVKSAEVIPAASFFTEVETVRGI